MSDQAETLRLLVQHNSAMMRRPFVAVVAGGNIGVGVTTLTVELATALCREGRRATIIDADLRNPTVSQRLSLTSNVTIDAVFEGARTIQEAVVRGPAGVQALLGTARNNCCLVSAESRSRLVNGMQRLGNSSDIVVIDAGTSVDPTMIQLWRHADLVLLVSTPEVRAIQGAYGAIKLAHEAGQNPVIATVVNRAPDQRIARDVMRRLIGATQRFLGEPILATPPIVDESPNGIPMEFVQFVVQTMAARGEVAGQQIDNRAAA